MDSMVVKNAIFTGDRKNTSRQQHITSRVVIPLFTFDLQNQCSLITLKDNAFIFCCFFYEFLLGFF
jgi:hypothetical protein